MAAGAAANAAAADASVQFNRDIRPIISENCFQCHGPDPGSRKAGLRLDTKDGFFAKTDKRGPTVMAGKPDESPLFQRITATDPDDVMPPPESHRELKPAQKELLKSWIIQGAPWEPHWSLIKPQRPGVPTHFTVHGSRFTVRNAIDALALKELEEKGLGPAPEADRRTLARRLSLDLTGLPPDPAYVEAFVNDASPDYYEKFVRKLMDSPHWGEHRARYWLDAARYADTHGLHFDNYREMWPYRDWVIGAFNRNQPFDRFTVEQIAGDLLPDRTLDQLIATGFHRCNITTNEGGTIVEENLANYARDRAETTSWVWLGLTANCAVCHDHKFDPIPTRDFYALSAFFRNTTQSGLDGNVKDSTPSVAVPAGTDQRRWDALPAEVATAKASLDERKKSAAPRFEQWLAAARPDDVQKEVSDDALVASVPLNEGAGIEINATCGQPMKFKATGPVVWRPDGKVGPAATLKAGATFDLGNLGDFEKDKAFSYGAWVNCAGTNAFAGIIARMDERTDYRGWDLFQHGANYAVHIVGKWPDDALKVTTTKSPVKPGEWQHVFVTYDGSGKPAGVRIFVNGDVAPTNTEHDSLRSSIRTSVPLRLGQRSVGQVFEGGSLQDVRVYSRRLKAAEVKSLAQAGSLRAMLALDAQKRTPQQRDALFDYFLTANDAAYKAAQAELAALEAEREAIKARSPVTHVQQEKMDSMPVAAVLFRGQYDQPKEKLAAATFSALHPLPEKAPNNRLGLAEWLVSPENPLTARVTVNRFWQEVFGTGLVKTAEDFGIMGDLPANPELLDWLAVEFRESGWDVKHLFRLIVTSSVYRQSAVATPDKLEKDPQNRLLSRGPRFRMDAEMVRDYALFASGSLNPKVGGPSVKPYQPEGVWEAVAMPESNTRNYKRDDGDGLYRRSLYTFWKRSAPPASLEIFNATAREVSCIRRERTNTPLQALVTMNDPQFVEAARNLAQLALRAAPTDPGKAVDFMAKRLLARSLRPEENEIISTTHNQSLAWYQANPQAAKDLLAVGESKADPKFDPALLASWTLLANQMMNLDEVLNK